MGWLQETVLDIAKGWTAVSNEVSIMKADAKALVDAKLLARDPNAYYPKADMVDPFAYEGLTSFGYREKLGLLDYNRLKLITFSDPVIAAILQTRINQVAEFGRPQEDKYKIGFKVKIKDPERSPTKLEQKRIEEITEFLLYCGIPEEEDDTPERRKRDNFEQFLRKVVRDSMTFDQLCFEVTPRRNGLPYEFNAVDASTIRILPDERDLRSMGNPQAMDSMREIQETMRVRDDKDTYRAKTPRFCQIMNGIVTHVFDETEMAFGVRNPRSDVLAFGYGFSELEMLVTIVTAHMNAEAYNRKFFSQGSTAKGILTFEGAVPRDQLQEFRRMWHMQATGIQNAWKTPIIAPGKETKVDWIDLQKANKEMEFGKWMEYCIKTMCSVYQIDPIEINFDISRMGQGENSNSQGLSSGGDPTARLVNSKDKGLKPLLRFLEQMLNDKIVKRLDPDFLFEFVGLNASTEESDLDQIEKEVKTYKTVNEIRAEHDLAPLAKLEDIESPGDLILDSGLITAWTQGKQAEAQAAMGQGQESESGDNAFNMESGNGAEESYEEEPDYENMSEEELQKELDNLGKPPKKEAAGGKEKGKNPVKKSFSLRL